MTIKVCGDYIRDAEEEHGFFTQEKVKAKSLNCYIFCISLNSTLFTTSDSIRPMIKEAFGTWIRLRTL